MNRVVAVKGQMAQQLAGVDGVEIKATIPEHQIDPALSQYGLEQDDNERHIYFFDTPDLQGFQAGVIGRARRVIGGKHDSTVKFRPIVPEDLPPLWQKFRGFKIEADAGGKGIVTSASLTMPVDKGLIKRVAAGTEPIAKLFTDEQQKFLLALAKQRLDFARIVVMGPLKSWKWKLTDPGLPWSLTAELWQRDDGARLFEVSIKAPLVQAAAAGAGFMAFLADVGAQRDEGQQAKTRWALEHYAKQARAGAGRSEAVTQPV